jgi:hypothetical protein
MSTDLKALLIVLVVLGLLVVLWPTRATTLPLSPGDPPPHTWQMP